MNTFKTTFSFAINLGTRHAAVFYIRPLLWQLRRFIDRDEKYAFVVVGPFELALDW